MSRLRKVRTEVLDKYQTQVLSLFRIVVGFLFACHGAATLFGIFGKDHAAAFGGWPSWWAAMIQLVGGTLIALGIATRTLAVLSSGSMAYAYFVVHQSQALLPIQNEGEASAMFCWAFLLLAFTGPGAWSLDRLLTRGRTEEIDSTLGPTSLSPTETAGA